MRVDQIGLLNDRHHIKRNSNRLINAVHRDVDQMGQQAGALLELRPHRHPPLSGYDVSVFRVHQLLQSALQVDWKALEQEIVVEGFQKIRPRDLVAMNKIGLPQLCSLLGRIDPVQLTNSLVSPLLALVPPACERIFVALGQHLRNVHACTRSVRHVGNQFENVSLPEPRGFPRSLKLGVANVQNLCKLGASAAQQDLVPLEVQKREIDVLLRCSRCNGTNLVHTGSQGLLGLGVDSSISIGPVRCQNTKSILQVPDDGIITKSHLQRKSDGAILMSDVQKPVQDPEPLLVQIRKLAI
mmetsp:Transcript_7283/g.17878  ORF Transcript_7283/g.17878 Transcript_7283/m.17878 type:complete len:298 (+) Transcript_7283:1534-2427(+)